VGDQDCRVFDFAGAAIDRGHTEPDPLTLLEAICQDTVVWIIGTNEECDVTPEDELAGRVAGLRLWRWRRLTSSLGRWLTLPGDYGMRRKRQQEENQTYRKCERK
jgi:hypothetical protein